MVNFRVGDRVEVVDASSSVLENGDIGTITMIEGAVAKVRVNDKSAFGNWIEFENLRLVPTDGQLIESLEKRVEVLERLVEDYFKIPVEPSTVYVEDSPKTPNQLRAEIIEKAKGFVDIKSYYLQNSTGCNGGYEAKQRENPNHSKWVLKAEFIVNADKRTVVALVKYLDGSLRVKGIAKCNPTDVFNEHIGKAIALGRALGLDVSEFEGAVQPTEFAKGQLVNYKDSELLEVKCIRKNVISEKAVYFTKGSWMHDYELTIINDTNAIYESEVE